ncbi:hypothetical protein [Streptomyces sp. 029-5]|uniref:hypothetical protein n=1 Tax=Streptomyces sp. 029-5 TaxID=2789261 RepID=UPI00398166EA
MSGDLVALPQVGVVGALLLDRDVGEADDERVGVVVLIQVVTGAGPGVSEADAAGREVCGVPGDEDDVLVGVGVLDVLDPVGGT